MSLAHKIGAIVGVLSLGMLSQAVVGGLHAWRGVQDQFYAGRINAVAQVLVDAASDLAVERTAAARVIADPGGAEGGFIQRAHAKRNEAMARLDEGIAGLRSLNVPDLNGPMTAVLDQLHVVDGLRSGLDRLAVEKKRDPAVNLRKEWAPAVNDLITAIIDLNMAVEDALPETVSPDLISIFELRVDYWRISEYTNRQRQVLGDVIAARGLLTTEQRATTFRADGVISNAWVAASRRSERISPALADVAQGALDVFNGDFETQREAIYGAGTSFGAYPVTMDQWLTAATEAIDAVQVAGQAVARAAAEEIEQETGTAYAELWLAAAIGLFAILMAIGAALFGQFYVARPIVRTTTAMDAIAHGDLKFEISGQHRSDEIGRLSQTLVMLRDAAAERNALRAEQAKAEERNQNARRQALQEMADTIDASSREALAEVGALAEALMGDAADLKTYSGHVCTNAETASTATHQVLDNAQRVAASAEQLAASIQDIGRKVGESTDIANTAVERARETQGVVARLSDVGDSIGEVVKLIGEIADQTNLLALNATIEAARAGEAGKGFAVVAGEVKSLAQQTASSTADIQARVSEIQSVSRQAASAISGVGSTIEDMNTITRSVAEAIEEQMSATHDIARNVNQSSDATQQVASLIRAVADEAGSAKASASTVETTSRTMSAAVTEFGTTVTRLVRTSTADTDRRVHERFELAVHVDTNVGGAGVNTVMLDVSKSGARLQAIDGARVGQSITVDVPRTQYRWFGKVVSLSDRGVHVQFDAEQTIDIHTLQAMSHDDHLRANAAE